MSQEGGSIGKWVQPIQLISEAAPANPLASRVRLYSTAVTSLSMRSSAGAITPIGDRALTRRLFFPPDLFRSDTGTPTLGVAGSATSFISTNNGAGRIPVWLFDDTVDEDILAEIVLPSNWAHTGGITMRAWVAPVVAQSVGSKFTVSAAITVMGNGVDLTSIPLDSSIRRGTDINITVSNVANILKVAPLGATSGSGSFNPGEWCKVGFGRSGTDANDDRNGDMAFFGLEIQYNADR